MKRLNYLVSEISPGFIINMDQVSSIKFNEDMKILSIVYQNRNETSFRGTTAVDLYDEITDYIEKNTED